VRRVRRTWPVRGGIEGLSARTRSDMGGCASQIHPGMKSNVRATGRETDIERGASTLMWLLVMGIFVLGMWGTWTGVSAAVAERGDRHSLCLKVDGSPSAKAQMGC